MLEDTTLPPENLRISMAKRIEVPGQGIVEFPDSMSDEQIVSAIRGLSAPPSATTPPVQPEPTGGIPLQDVGLQAIRNAPASMGKMLGDIATAVTSPAQTAGAIGEVVGGLRSKALGAISPSGSGEAIAGLANIFSPAALSAGIRTLTGYAKPTQQELGSLELRPKEEREAAANAMGQMYAQRYGGTEAIKKTIATDPFGVAADLSTLLTAGGGAGIRGAGAVGRAIDPLNVITKPIGAAGKYIVEPVLSNSLGVLTGSGEAAVRQAARAGMEGSQEFTSQMRGQGDIAQAVDMAKNALNQIRGERSTAYREGMIPVKSDKAILDYKPIYSALDDAQKFARKEGEIVNEAADTILAKMRDRVDAFYTNPNIRGTPEDFDALKQSLGEVYSETRAGTKARSAADEIYNATKNQITKQAPTYAGVMDDYSKASKELSELTSTFSLGERASTDTTLRKLQSIMRNNVNTNYGQRTKLMDILARYEPELPNVIAGQSMSSVAPRGLARLGSVAGGVFAGTTNPAALPLLAATSPRLVGEAAYAGGRAVGTAQRAGINAANLQALQRGMFQSGRAKEELENRAYGLLGK